MKPLLLRPEEAFELLGLPEIPEGIRRTKLDRNTVRYYREDVEAWADGWRPGPPPRNIRDFQAWARVKGVVYWIADDEDSPVKIGWTRGDPSKRRLSEIQLGCWLPLHVHGFFEAERGDEADTHAALAEYRIRGEWFEREPALAYLTPRSEAGSSGWGVARDAA